MTFDVDVLEGELTGGDGPAALFIDRFGFGGFHAGGFHAGGFGGFHAAGFRGGYARVGGVGRVGLSALATIPTSHAVPGIGELPMQLLQSAALRSVRRRSVPRRRTHIRTAAITPTRLATEAARIKRLRARVWHSAGARGRHCGGTKYEYGKDGKPFLTKEPNLSSTTTMPASPRGFTS